MTITTSVWRRIGGTWEGFDHHNVECWESRDGKTGRVGVSSVKMAGGLAEGFADVELSGEPDEDDRRMYAAALAAKAALEESGGAFGKWRHER